MSVPAFASQVPSAPPPLVLAGGIVIDVSDWGRSANDLAGAVVIIQGDRITDVGPASILQIPKGARIIDCTGKYIIPGLVDGFEGMNSQGEASANLYMGVTTAVVSSDSHRGHIDFAVNPSPHLYLLDSVGTTDDWSLLIGHYSWTSTLRVLGHPTELSPEDTERQLTDTARLGTKAVFLGHYLTAVNTQWIIARAHQMGLVTYGEFVATPYRVGIEGGVDALLHMGRYELGLIPDELEQPLVDDPEGPAATTAYDYSERLPPTDIHVARYARFIASHHAALMPTFAMDYLRLPGPSHPLERACRSLAESGAHVQPAGQQGRDGLSVARMGAAPAGHRAAIRRRKPAQESGPGGAAAVAPEPGHLLCLSALPGRLPARRWMVRSQASRFTWSWRCWCGWD